MDINALRSISTILVMIAFAGVCWWAFSPKRKKQFEEASNLVFSDDVNTKNNPEGEAGQPESGEERHK
ncbi:CcoQ/FixQ family Cbb3-type cytochrome c oxidase assembly chaperone [Sessilibacter sp. MAH1]